MLSFTISDGISVIPSLHGWSILVDGVERQFSDYATSTDLISSICSDGFFMTMSESSLIDSYYQIAHAA